MHMMTFTVEDNLVDAFQKLVKEQFADTQVECVKDEKLPGFVVSSREEVLRRLEQAERSESLDEEAYRQEMDAFLRTL